MKTPEFTKEKKIFLRRFYFERFLMQDDAHSATGSGAPLVSTAAAALEPKKQTKRASSSGRRRVIMLVAHVGLRSGRRLQSAQGLASRAVASRRGVASVDPVVVGDSVSTRSACGRSHDPRLGEQRWRWVGPAVRKEKMDMKSGEIYE